MAAIKTLQPLFSKIGKNNQSFSLVSVDQYVAWRYYGGMAHARAKKADLDSRTFLDGAIYLYRRKNSRRGLWEIRLKVHGHKGYILRSSGTANEQLTINGARGFTQKIADRFDLTLECIRRHYDGEDSPLAPTLGRYGGFFALFGGFEGYIAFFLLQDLVESDRRAIRFFTAFDDFASPAVPKDVAEYSEYRRRSIDFVEARNRRIEQYVGLHLS